VLVLAVVACIGVVALATSKGRALRHRAEPRVDQSVAEKNAQEVRDPADSHLTRLEYAIDAIAIEVERITENQRFLTKLLANEPPENARSAEARREL
jgi:hypothetical protein